MNKLKLLNCVMFLFQCEQCQKVYKSPIYLGGYGQFLLNSHGGYEKSWLDATSNETFREVHDIVKLHPKLVQINKRSISRLHQQIVGYSYDPDVNGNYFGINVKPACPSCGGQRVCKYEEIIPNEVVSIEVSHVTSRNWDSLSSEEKKSYVYERIEHFL